ncbi:MAG: SH3 domain-containing protein, partial [Bacteroidota bacterium]
ARLHIARGEPPAVLALERASRLDPLSSPLATARREAYVLAGQVAPAVPAPIVASRTVLSRLGAGLFVALALVLYLAWVALGALWYRRRTRALTWAGITLAPLALAAIVLASLSLWDAGRPLAVALADVSVQTRPSPEASASGSIRAGEVLRVGEAEGLWRRVEIGDVEGWVPERSVEGL